MQCQKLKIDNTQCKGNTMLDSQYCYFHNPAVKDKEKQTNRAKGGKNNAITVIEPLEPLKIEKTADVVILLTQTVNQVRAGKLEARIANCLGVLSGHLIRAFEVSDLERRIEKIEKAVEHRA